VTTFDELQNLAELLFILAFLQRLLLRLISGRNVPFEHFRVGTTSAALSITIIEQVSAVVKYLIQVKFEVLAAVIIKIIVF
jgi:hypothetical protein